jgi:hypothetical protein
MDGDTITTKREDKVVVKDITSSSNTIIFLINNLLLTIKTILQALNK